MSAFSRLQLAAALLEYDNDLDNPDAPNRSAQESAIFLPFRQTALHRGRKNDYLGVPIPGEGVPSARSIKSSSALAHQSRMSISTLHNPFGRDDHLEEEETQQEQEEIEVDLSSWGLDAFIPKDKASKNGKGKEKSTDPLSPHSVSSVTAHQPYTNHDTAVRSPRRALAASRSMSVGGDLEYFATEGESLRPSLKLDKSRRRSIASPLDTAGMEAPSIMQRRRASSYSHSTTYNSSQPLSVPFPSSSIRSGSLDVTEDDVLRSSSLGSQLGPVQMHERTRSTTSAGSQVILKDAEHQDNRQRTMSNATMATILLAEDNPFAIRPPSRASRFDPKAAAHARTMSNASMGSRMILDQDRMSTYTSAPDGRDRRYSTTLDLLRPKVLVMPSPLQPTSSASSPPINEKLRDGFELSTDGPPLPPGARSSRRASTTLSTIEKPPLASNSFTPNPLASLSLSQMTFRNTLKIDGHGDSYVDTDIPRAIVDGEQAQFEIDQEEVPIIAINDANEPTRTSRPAGKLYGKSLIDDLEHRKAQMKSKQRVFTGDERPSMMARSNQRSSTLIDPATLQSRPVSQHMNSFGPPASNTALTRRNSANIKPLLNFDDEEKAPLKTPGARLQHGRSVFGVDTLWEREMAKLKEIEAQEEEEERKRKLREAAEGENQTKKKSKKKKNRKSPPAPEPENLSPHNPVEPRVSVEPPVLPDIPRASRKAPPQLPDDASDSDASDASEPLAQKTQGLDPNWHAVSSDEEENGPRRMTGTGPRFPSKSRHNHTGSDDDVPLARSVLSNSRFLSADSDEDRPLSTLVQKKPNSNLLNIDFNNLGRSDDDEDNQPLGLRASMLVPSLPGNSHDAIDDDDKPLAFHPEQQRRSQLQMMATQQQQLMMQAQMQSMYFTPPSIMGPAFFGPPMMPMMMQPPMPIPSPPPMHDQAKFNRVDSWRHDVAVEGDT
ncbi:hypothetical protein H0H92_000843 [Tricholoma furcatifolium]|nr:hypothetical protein H0H92_000843 [Tricholoma furcatifolium]